MGNFLITLLGGWCGLHKFLSGKIGMGFVYLLTFGLFGIGWIYDCFVAFKNIGKPAAGFQNQPPALSDAALRRRLQIIDDCMTLTTTTNNADVFFPRYDLLLKTLVEIGDFETHDKWQASRQESTKNFIIRAYNSALVRADGMKTEKGKHNQFVAVYGSIEKYRSDMSAETTAFFEEKFNSKLYNV